MNDRMRTDPIFIRPARVEKKSRGVCRRHSKMPPRVSTAQPAAHVTATPVIFEPAPPAGTKTAIDKNLRLDYFESDNIHVSADVSVPQTSSNPFLSITILSHPTALARIGEVAAAWALLATLLRFASDLLEAKAQFENAAPIFNRPASGPRHGDACHIRASAAG